MDLYISQLKRQAVKARPNQHWKTTLKKLGWSFPTNSQLCSSSSFFTPSKWEKRRNSDVEDDETRLPSFFIFPSLLYLFRTQQRWTWSVSITNFLRDSLESCGSVASIHPLLSPLIMPESPVECSPSAGCLLLKMKSFLQFSPPLQSSSPAWSWDIYLQVCNNNTFERCAMWRLHVRQASKHPSRRQMAKWLCSWMGDEKRRVNKKFMSASEHQKMRAAKKKGKKKFLSS